MSAGAVIKIMKSLAYVTTAVLVVRCTILLPMRCRSNIYIRGFKTKANSNMVTGQPCLTEHCMGKGPATLSLICTEERALSYIA